MAFTFDSTIGGAASNSYVSVTEADDYFGGSLDDAQWANLSATEKEQLLTMATNRLESESFGGQVASTTQRLQFPRDYLKHRNYPLVTYYENTVVPKEVQTATFELGLYFLQKSLDELGLATEYDQETLDSYTVGPLTVAVKAGLTVEKLPTKVARALAAIGDGAWTGGGQRSVVRG